MKTNWRLPEGRGIEGRAKWQKGSGRFRLPIMEGVSHRGKRHGIKNIVNGIVTALYGE